MMMRCILYYSGRLRNSEANRVVGICFSNPIPICANFQYPVKINFSPKIMENNFRQRNPIVSLCTRTYMFPKLRIHGDGNMYCTVCVGAAYVVLWFVCAFRAPFSMQSMNILEKLRSKIYLVGELITSNLFRI